MRRLVQGSKWARNGLLFKGPEFLCTALGPVPPPFPNTKTVEQQTALFIMQDVTINDINDINDGDINDGDILQNALGPIVSRHFHHLSLKFST